MRKPQHQARTFGERQFWASVALILVAALVFRLPGIASRSLWIDELYTEWFAARSFVELWTEVPQFETHPPLYYSILRAWTLVFGNSELGLRSLSLLFSLGTVLVVAVSGRLLDAGWEARAAGLVGAALLAVNYAGIREAQNARPYALQALVCSIAIVAALMLVTRLREQPGDKLPARRWLPPAIVLGIAAGTGLWLHNTGFFIAFGLWLGLALTLFATPADRRWHSFLIFFGSGVLALALWLPYLPIFSRPVEQVHGPCLLAHSQAP
ncbi:MAG: glycosyltransferase family 39 protein [Rhizobium sp.]|nr:glycosyltransferase family 39 protein [Rhizobium sp.]